MKRKISRILISLKKNECTKNCQNIVLYKLLNFPFLIMQSD